MGFSQKISVLLNLSTLVVSVNIEGVKGWNRRKYSILSLLNNPSPEDQERNFYKAPIVFPGALQKTEQTRSQQEEQQAVSAKLEQVCMYRCRFQITSEYNPVCGSDDTSYHNRRFLECAQRCGKSKLESEL